MSRKRSAAAAGAPDTTPENAEEQEIIDLTVDDFVPTVNSSPQCSHDEVEVVERPASVPVAVVSAPTRGNQDDDIEVTGVANQHRYIHSRQDCPEFPFAEPHFPSHCEKCYCYICDAPVAQCTAWTLHCKATHRHEKWRQQRRNAKQVRDAAATGRTVSAVAVVRRRTSTARPKAPPMSDSQWSSTAETATARNAALALAAFASSMNAPSRRGLPTGATPRRRRGASLPTDAATASNRTAQDVNDTVVAVATITTTMILTATARSPHANAEAAPASSLNCVVATRSTPTTAQPAPHSPARDVRTIRTVYTTPRVVAAATPAAAMAKSCPPVTTRKSPRKKNTST